MTPRRLCHLAVAAAAIASALPADAGHRRSRSCAPCAGSSGNWYHFTSGRGMYVPFASETTPVSRPTGSRVIYATGPATYHGHAPPAGYAPPVRYSTPCRGCGVR
ncbi:MAG TPA: hypothetical protein VF170_18015 [Planctomycetaceae bacterium]